MAVEVVNVEDIAAGSLLSISGLPFGIRRYQAPLVPEAEDLCRVPPMREKSSSSRRRHSRSDPKKSRHRHRAAMEDRSYLDDHKILPFVDKMLKILVKDRPNDPWKAIADMLPEADIEPFMSYPDKPVLVDVGDLSNFRKPYQFQPSVGTWLSMKQRFVPVSAERSGVEESKQFVPVSVERSGVEENKQFVPVSAERSGVEESKQFMPVSAPRSGVEESSEATERAALMKKRTKEIEDFRKPYEFQPSVGTWLSMQRQVVPVRAESSGTEESIGASEGPALVKKRTKEVEDSAMGEAAAMVEVRDCPFDVVVDISAEEQMNMPFCLKPSVGTWQSRLRQDEKDKCLASGRVSLVDSRGEEVKSKEVLDIAASRYDWRPSVGTWQQVLRDGQKVAARQEQEITLEVCADGDEELEITRYDLTPCVGTKPDSMQVTTSTAYPESALSSKGFSTMSPIPKAPLDGSLVESEVSSPSDRSDPAARLVHSSLAHAEAQPLASPSNASSGNPASFASGLVKISISEAEYASVSDRSYTRSTLAHAEARATAIASHADHDSIARGFQKGLIECKDEGVTMDAIINTSAPIPRLPLEGSVVESELSSNVSYASDGSYAAARLVRSTLQSEEWKQEADATFAKIIAPVPSQRPLVESDVLSQLTCSSDKSYTSLISNLHLDIIRSTLGIPDGLQKGLVESAAECAAMDANINTSSLIPREPLEGSLVESELSCPSGRSDPAARLVHSSLAHAEAQPLASPSNASSGNPASFASGLVKISISEAEYASVSSSQFTLQRDSRPSSGRTRSRTLSASRRRPSSGRSRSIPLLGLGCRQEQYTTNSDVDVDGKMQDAPSQRTCSAKAEADAQEAMLREDAAREKRWKARVIEEAVVMHHWMLAKAQPTEDTSLGKLK